MRIVLVLAVLAAIGCESSEQVKNDPSFADDVKPIFTSSCATSGCHADSNPKGNYVLTSRAGALGNGSDTVPNVIPGDSDSSLLYQRIDLGDMPPSGPLDAMKSATIRNWINQGAKDN